MTAVEALARVRKWEATRTHLADREASGDYPRADEWENSDRDAVDLVAALRTELEKVIQTGRLSLEAGITVDPVDLLDLLGVDHG